MAFPLPEGVTVMDPAIRYGRYFAVGAIGFGELVVRWHVWDTAGTYAGFATTPELIGLVIARYERENDL
ncbi:hypothetical protein ACFP1Z_06675 [Streptomyces gamaensis]|uniref:Uncharacterized protein n=1 Tax=Streptomyces gamaensis TaxID=1763542 RepID=A0ABW0YUI9_9ACTN